MKQFYATTYRGSLLLAALAGSLFLSGIRASAQSCPMSSTTNLVSAFPNTYYPSNQSDLLAGGKIISLGPAVYGSDPIAVGDVLLIIQMQGAEINPSNSNNYGSNTAIGGGYLVNANLMAGQMEYVVAASSVPVTGGPLTLLSGTTHAYHNAVFGGDGQYSFQIIRVPVTYSLKLTANLTAPTWNGHTGGVVVLYAVDSIIMNGDTIFANGAGFRGGGGRQLSGGAGSSTDYLTASTNNANGSKGEGIAGTPRFTTYKNTLVDSGNAIEGYPSGSFARGAPGNAGGGGTDGNPSGNTDNSGGGGGGNGGIGGNGGKSWSSNLAVGGRGGTFFSSASPSRVIMGGGGGAGTTNNGTGSPGSGLASSGAAGGGIVIMTANTISGPGVINVNGADANSTVINDGSGGAGAGGSVVLYGATGNLGGITIFAKGGNGGTNTGGGAPHGPGGGGGGGNIYANATLNASSSATGGNQGSTAGSPSTYGAVNGTPGNLKQTITQAQLPVFPLVCSILSLNFLSVDAQQQNGQVAIKWTVANETNTREYSVEKSLDGSNFAAIGIVAYQPTGASINQYIYIDNNDNSVTGALYYRVKEVDESGHTVYSKVVSIRTNDGASVKLAVYPNPANGSATISFTATVQGPVSLRLIDLKGRLLWQTEYQANAGMNQLPLSAIRMLSDGIYLLEWSDGQTPETVKLIVGH
jgi:Secretion system C-terminal sorting domain